jgi:teichuronic acid biosynthesis glycosyltransferase TuaC
MLLAEELKIPYVVSVHGLDAYSTNQVTGRAGEWCRRVTRKVFRSAARVICVSEHVRQQVLAQGEKGYRTSVVYNGVDPVLFHPATEPVSSSPALIASVGTLIPIKGHQILLRAIAAIKYQHPDVVCEIVGKGPERPPLEALARELGIADRVRLLERQSRRVLASTLQRATLFALPSRYEGLGCVYLEAMASGKVAIGCRGQGIEEIINHGDNGWLIGPDSVQDLAAGLSELLRNQPLRELLAERGRQTVLNDLTLTHQAERLLAIYRECAS